MTHLIDKKKNLSKNFSKKILLGSKGQWEDEVVRDQFMGIYIFFICLLIMGGCTSGHLFQTGMNQDFVQHLPISKQKQRIAVLQKKLEHAKKNLQTAQEIVDQLNVDLYQSQLVLISKQIENYEKTAKKIPSDSAFQRMLVQKDDSSLFIRERETLQQMLENGPSPEAFEAQIILDRILRAITESKEIVRNGEV